jgi:predicted RecA/RadA family phage recombinase
MKNYVEGGEVIDLAAPYAVASGAGMKVGQFIAIAACDAANGATVAGYLQGVFDVLKEGAGSGQAWAVGDLVYWDNTAKQFTKTSTSNTKAGYAAGAALTTDVVGRLRLVPGLAG